LLRIHQQRLGPDVRGDISLYRGALPEATSISLAAHLLGKGGGEDDRAAARVEQKILLQETLNAMDPLDREVLTLRHCEHLSNDEAATVLSISPAQASEAYIRALKRISAIMASLPVSSAKPQNERGFARRGVWLRAPWQKGKGRPWRQAERIGTPSRSCPRSSSSGSVAARR
jgi:hypothetical protein